ncbi:eamA-like transporter family protein [Mycobacterium ulcerans str. Harvey]|uniref:EamA-like transporter family protein n=1 Tax=Mycobacterium ulcerans str. Harvey TaxID=1299332 RepID=A0ABP3A6J6_MYCUL|nr:eamA-like transporter family protein [Mycobacterium ulcerans str. Harvey]
MILGSCVSLQLGAAIATPLLAHFGAGLTTGVRLLFAATLLMAIHRPRAFGWDRQQWRSAALFAVALAGMNGFFFAAIARIPLSVAVTIEFAGPLMLAAAFSRRPRDLGCVMAAAAAIVVLSWDGSKSAALSPDLAGVAFALVAACFWALYILAGKRITGQQTGHGALSVSKFIAAIVVLPFGIPAVPTLTGQPEKLIPPAGGRGAVVDASVLVGIRGDAALQRPHIRRAAQSRTRGRRARRLDIAGPDAQLGPGAGDGCGCPRIHHLHPQPAITRLGAIFREGTDPNTRSSARQRCGPPARPGSQRASNGTAPRGRGRARGCSVACRRMAGRRCIPRRFGALW